MQSTFLKYSLVTFIAALIAACTEVIHIDLNASDPQIVVQAFVVESGSAEVRLNQSVNFEDANIFPPVSGASVFVEDDFGNSVQLMEISPGRYFSSHVHSEPGKSYRIIVYKDDLLITAEDRMPAAVRMDSLTIRKFKFPIEGFEGRLDTLDLLEAVAWYTDPADDVNYYRFLEYRNDTLIGMSLTEDRFNNGRSIGYSMVSFSNPLMPGDRLMVEMQSISRPVYEYLFGFSGVNGGPLASSPSNPATNLTGTRLGYFSAHTVHRLSLVVPLLSGSVPF
jgi:hypothetical protein